MCYLHTRSMPKFADMLLSEFRDELLWLVEFIVGFNDKFKGPSPVDSLKLPPEKDGTEIPDGLPFVGGNFITSTLSIAGGDVQSEAS